MLLYRLVRQKHLGALSGSGAARYGARWNSRGAELIYTATSRALAMSEVAVHLSFSDLPDDYFMMEILVPDTVSQQILTEDELPEDWNAFPHSPATQRLGDTFVNDRSACLFRVPSAVVKSDWNVLINPQHPDFAAITISGQEKFPFDPRFLRT